MSAIDLPWLPVQPDWASRVRATEAAADWGALQRLAGARPDLPMSGRLDRLLLRMFPRPPAAAGPPVRLALLGSASVQHLAGPIRVAALRHGLHVAIHQGEYGQYRQDLLGPDPALAAFAPDTVLLSLDARHCAAGLSPTLDDVAAAALLDGRLEAIRSSWALARRLAPGAAVIQQTVLPVHPTLLGLNEQRLPGSPAEFVRRLNARLREAAEQDGVALLAIDAAAAQAGIAAWHDPAAWHHAKQEVSGRATLLYGDLVARLLAAARGRSAKVLVLDLDNTLWGGVIGDDGLDGIVLGQGSATGEAFAAVQDYALALAQRGVILAVCSKNDEANAYAPFDHHPEMRLHRDDIACFVANWDDKATGLRRIAASLNLGLDSLVLLDDNPAERALIRRELPQVQVPEIDDDPALVPQRLADAGYFESLGVTADDRARTAQYRDNRARVALAEAATDLPGYLRSLEMRLVWRRFDEAGLLRVVQLVNKTNQFNLTTRRTTVEAMRALLADPRRIGLQLRLLDRFGDNGIVVVIIGALSADGVALEITDWLMSCRVLGRQVEQATLALIAGQARRPRRQPARRQLRADRQERHGARAVSVARLRARTRRG